MIQNRKQLEQELKVFADNHSVSRAKVETYDFDLDYRRQPDGSFTLHSEKAVIRTLGKTTKVPIGGDHPHKTFEEAEAATKAHWQEYYKKVRANRSEKERIQEAKRQKRYREKRKAEQTALKQRQ